MGAVFILWLKGSLVLLLLMATRLVSSEDTSFAAAQVLVYKYQATDTLVDASVITDKNLEFDYIQGSPKGPDEWGNLHPEWYACKNGTQQSPIDIENRRVIPVPSSYALLINYQPANASLQNSGHDIRVQWLGDAGFIAIYGVPYFLTQCHWHSPSEHTFNGRRFVLEQHCVHVRRDGTYDNVPTIAVIGTLYKIGRSDPFLSQLKDSIISISGSQNETNLGILDPMAMKISNEEYYRYLGSLTTPPCTEGLIWTVSRRIKTVSNRQVTLLKNAVQYANARPLQPLNGRNIYFYKSRSQENLDMLIDEMK